MRERSGQQLTIAPSPQPSPAGAREQEPRQFEQAALPSTVNDTSNYEAILTDAQLDAWLHKLMAAPLVSMDTETTGLDAMTAQLVGISFSIEAHQAAYLPLAHHYPGAPDQLNREHALKKLKHWLESPAHKKLGQNLKYDQHIFANHGIALRGIAEDTLLQSYVLESHKPHDMGNLALRHLGLSTVSYADVVGKGAKQIGFDQVDLETATRYAAEDADITLQLHQTLSPQLQGRLDAVYRDIEMPVREVLFKMERNGVLIDSSKLARQSHELGEKIMAIEKQAFELAGQPFNLASPKQLQEILFDKLGIPSKKKTATGSPSTDEEVLQELALDYPLPKILLEHRGMAKLKSTYTDKLPQMVNRQDRPRAHQLLAGGGGDRAPGLQRSQPAEHPDPHTRRPPHPRSVHRARRFAHRLRRLFADRTAHHGAPVRRRRPAQGLRRRRRHPPRHRRRSVRRAAGRA